MKHVDGSSEHNVVHKLLCKYTVDDGEGEITC